MGAQVGGERVAPVPAGWLRRGMLAVAAVIALVTAAPAQATFHEILVREVYSGGAGNDSFVVLQAYSGGQNLLSGHSVTAYNAAGTPIGTFTFSSSVASSLSQMTILVADTGYATTFPSGPAPDGTLASLDLNPAGGAVCWTGLDCVAWGSFGGTISPSPGSPAASPGGIAPGMALRRKITGGSCSNRLDLGDDTNDSEADFAQAAPHPRNNASPIEEGSTCTPPLLPSAEIDSAPAALTKTTSAAFTYHSNPPGASFECKLDLAAFAACAGSGISYPGPLTDGEHTFQVRAQDVNGTGPAKSRSWTVDTTPPTTSIKTHPVDPSPGGSAAFTYESNEANSDFQCRLSPSEASFTSCAKTGKTYSNLANGDYTFELLAIDPTGNAQATPTSFPWTVDNSLKDETPPETTLLSRPADPSGSSTASFTYSSNEPGSSFECALDGAGLSTCPTSGITYSGLGNGLHSFQARAIDPSGNPDATPAGYSFTVVLAGAPLPVPGPLPAAPLPASAPDTKLLGKPAARTRDRTPTFRFGSSQPGASFQCKLDRQPFKACRSPLTTKSLTYGRHTIEIRAVLAGARDSTPATLTFKVVKPK